MQGRRVGFAAWLGCTVIAACGERPPPELVLYGGRVYTQDPAQPWAEALAIAHGRLAFVGSDAALVAWLDGVKPARSHRLDGRLVLPGFIDAHVHPLAAGVERRELDLSAQTTGAGILAATASYAAAHPALAWVVGHGWALPAFPEANPQRGWLDEVVPDRPAYLEAADGHSGWVNSRALALAGITRDTPDPPNGRIERDASGEPSGTLREAALRLVTDQIPKPILDERVAALGEAVALMSRVGITGFHEASADAAALAAYVAADERGLLPARVKVSLSLQPTEAPPASVAAELSAAARAVPPSRIEVGNVKLFLDGVIESRTAAMLAPYADTPADAGTLIWEPRVLMPLAVALDRVGFDLHFHVIGDRAVRTALDAGAAVRRANPWRDRHMLLAHVQVVDPADLPRFASSAAVPVFQPLWACEDSYIAELTVPKLGPARSRWLYPMASVAGQAELAFGSDWSVSSVNPLEGIETAVTRVDARNGPEARAPFIPEERLSLEAAVRAYTLGSARALGWADQAGALIPGRSADLVVLSRDIFAGPAEGIGDAEVLATVFAGQVVFADGPLAAWR